VPVLKHSDIRGCRHRDVDIVNVTMYVRQCSQGNSLSVFSVKNLLLFHENLLPRDPNEKHHTIYLFDHCSTSNHTHHTHTHHTHIWTTLVNKELPLTPRSRTSSCGRPSRTCLRRSSSSRRSPSPAKKSFM